MHEIFSEIFSVTEHALVLGAFCICTRRVFDLPCTALVNRDLLLSFD